jgi:Tol biopolymer transport system component
MRESTLRFARVAGLTSLAATTVWLACTPLGPAAGDEVEEPAPEEDQEPPADSPTAVPISEFPVIATDAFEPPGAPRIAEVFRFDLWAKDAGEPPAGKSNLAWFLGSHSPSPAWSPDGRHIAHHDGRCVSVRRLDGELTKKIRTKNKKYECRTPRWSPTGNKIVTSHSFHGPGAIFDVKSGKSTKLARKNGNWETGYWGLSYAPDGKRLIGRMHQVGTAYVDPKSGKPTMIVSEDGPNPVGFFPSFSPDGKYAARVLGNWRGKGADLEILRFDAAGKRGKVADPWEEKVMHASLKGERQARISGDVVEYAWSGDARIVAAIRAERYPGYDDYEYPHGELVVLDVESGQARSAADGARNPSLSQDGKFVAFERAEESGVWLLDTTQPEQQPWLLYEHGIEPLWSPAGDHLLVLDPSTKKALVLRLE